MDTIIHKKKKFLWTPRIVMWINDREYKPFVFKRHRLDLLDILWMKTIIVHTQYYLGPLTKSLALKKTSKEIFYTIP